MDIERDKQRINPYHPDIKLFLVLIPVINCFNYYLTYTNVKFNLKFAFTFTIDVLQGYLAWWILRLLVLYLDQKMPYESGMIKRIIVQVLTTTFTGLLVIALTTEALSFLVRGKPADLSFYTFDLVIISIWFFVINGIYVGLHYYRLWEQAGSHQIDQVKKYLIVSLGKQNLRLYPNEIVGFQIANNYVIAYSREGKSYMIDDALDTLEKKLASTHFFRINRQVILYRNMIKGFRPTENGKLDIIVRDTAFFPEILSMSRLKAPSFRRWFEQGKLTDI